MKKFEIDRFLPVGSEFRKYLSESGIRGYQVVQKTKELGRGVNHGTLTAWMQGNTGTKQNKILDLCIAYNALIDEMK
jgi:hypothetical protein